MVLALSTLQKRIISALIAGPLTLLVMIYGGVPFLLLIAVGAGICLYEFLMMERKGGANVVRNMAMWAAYTALCAMAFVRLRMDYDAGLWLVLALMLTVWACDIGAYFSGKTFGGPKMAPTISPNKTVSGLAGGVLCSGFVLMGFDVWHDLFAVHTGIVFITGLFMGLVGQAGDLLISALKRRVSVKDTGNILPGHGGLLDRIDSLLLVTPFFLMACMVWLA